MESRSGDILLISILSWISWKGPSLLLKSLSIKNIPSAMPDLNSTHNHSNWRSKEDELLFSLCQPRTKKKFSDWKHETRRKWYEIYLLISLWWIVSDSSHSRISCHTSGNDWYFIISTHKTIQKHTSTVLISLFLETMMMRKTTSRRTKEKKLKDKCFVYKKDYHLTSLSSLIYSQSVHSWIYMIYVWLFIFFRKRFQPCSEHW